NIGRVVGVMVSGGENEVRIRGPGILDGGRVVQATAPEVGVFWIAEVGLQDLARLGEALEVGAFSPGNCPIVEGTPEGPVLYPQVVVPADEGDILLDPAVPECDILGVGIPGHDRFLPTLGPVNPVGRIATRNSGIVPGCRRVGIVSEPGPPSVD